MGDHAHASSGEADGDAALKSKTDRGWHRRRALALTADRRVLQSGDAYELRISRALGKNLI
jgi:hypothetical protein